MLMHPCFLLTLVQASYAFNLLRVVSQFNYPSCRPIFPYISHRTSGLSLLSQRGATSGWILTPSSKIASLQIFEEFILNTKDLKDIKPMAIGESFKVPNPSIFGKSFEDESDFGKSLFRDRIRPKLENAKVFLYNIMVYSVASD